MNTVKEALAVESSRKAETFWTREDGYRVKIVTRHDKARKAYITTISECVARKRDGYTMEFHRMYVDFNRLINSEAAARFNFNKMQTIHAEIVSAMVQDVESLLASREPVEKEVA